MIQEDKELLLKDICSRLPYGIKASYYGTEEECETWDEIESVTLDGYVEIGQYSLPIERIKPYLFPLSSISNRTLEEINPFVDAKTSNVIMEFFNSRHIDYRGLIEKGLAIDATGLNIY